VTVDRERKAARRALRVQARRVRRRAIQLYFAAAVIGLIALAITTGVLPHLQSAPVAAPLFFIPWLTAFGLYALGDSLAKKAEAARKLLDREGAVSSGQKPNRMSGR
jgi:peptidoglycan/LPS O-acetylase OafA/YrhL